MVETRRTFLAAGVAGLATSARGGSSNLTANAVIQRIKDHVGIPWLAQTVDRIVAGDANTPVTGIASLMMATFEAVRESVDKGANLVITHEPTFYSHQDTASDLTKDPVFLEKSKFIHGHNVVIFRFHDHWHRMTVDGIARGMEQQLGWTANAVAGQQYTYRFEPVSLQSFAQDIASKLKDQNMRVIGNPNLSVRNVRTNWGAVSRDITIPALARPDTDVLVVGEPREWELVEYAQDAVTARQNKGLIIVGHVLSEQWGMKYCAEWLKTFISEVPVQFIEEPDPFQHYSASAR